MKQKDLALIIVIAFISAIASFFVSRTIFTTSQNRQQEVEVVQPISATFSAPDNRYFNNKSLNPTRLIEIRDNNNQNPFSGSN